jgi:thioredoxin 2
MPEPLHIVCPHCSAVNRVPAERLGGSANCGKCHHPLFEGRPVELDAAGFEKHVTRNDIPVVVDFWAQWCGPCHMMAPAFAQAAAELEPRVRLAKLDTEAAQGIAARYGIRGIPTLIVFRRGHEVARQAGAMDLGSLLSWIRANV